MSGEAAQAARCPGTGRGAGRAAFASVSPANVLISIAENGDPKGGVVSFRSTHG